jgi:ferric-dicitrate binding protein FerR (iron transport regulator)
MSTDCDRLAALLSERRRGELSSEDARALDAHLAGCARCREEATGLESVLAAVELPPVSIQELEALRSRRIGEGPRPVARSGAWKLPAVLVAAAAAAVLTVSVRPASRHHAAPTAPVETAAVSAGGALQADDRFGQDLFPEMTSDTGDDGQVSLEEDVLSLEGPGLFGNLDG